MHPKSYTLRGCAVTNGKDTFIELNLEFDGHRAFVVWDSINVGRCRLKARLEIDRKLLKRVKEGGCDYLYRGQIILPKPENN